MACYPCIDDRAVVRAQLFDIRFLFLFQIREIGVWWSGESAVITEVSQCRRMQTLKPLSPVKTYGTIMEFFSFSFFFFFPFFSPICPWSFFSRGLRTGDRQSAASCIASPCRAKTSSDDSQDYHRNYSKMFEAVDYLSRAYSTGTQWPKKKSTSYRSCLFYFFSKKNPGILVEFLFLEQRCKRGKVYKICEGIYVESNDILNFKSDYKYPTPRWNWG